MGNFLGLQLNTEYRSSSHLIGRDFFGLLLPMAAQYDRAAAFFSSSVFLAAAEAFADFFERGGKVRLVCSPAFSSQDVRALQRALYERPAVLKDGRSLARLFELDDGGAILAQLVARGLLHMRIAVPTNALGPAVYHEKIGLFRDDEHQLLAFSGSANESRTAWVRNFERVDVFASWGGGPERDRARRIELHFLELWRNDTRGLKVMELHQAFADGLIEELEEEQLPPMGSPRRLPTRRVEAPPETLIPDPTIALFEHQLEAIQAWGAARGRGMLEMATGSGKTITALSLATKLYEGVGSGLCVVIVAPYIHLVDQWRSNAARFGLRPIRCAESRRSWYDELAAAVRSLNAGRRAVLSVATTSSTLTRPHLQELLARVKRPMLIIGDEAHNYGARNILAALPKNATYRLGLSATPDRWMDDEGSDALREYFGDVVYRYGLDDAIRDEVLTPYRYHPVLVGLTPEELDEYLDLTKALGRYLHGEKDGGVSDAALRLLLKRARLIGSAASKLPRLRELLRERRHETHILVYCGDGSVEGPDPDESARQVEEAVRIIGADLGMTCASYTAATPPDRRQELLRLFASGDLQVLVAIRCLDEGVDVPATRSAYILASSTNPRQFIQRRGRVLRRFPGKRRAEIFDFFVSPPVEALPVGSEEFRVVRRLFGNQIQRAKEFADLAENGPVARSALLELTSHLRLFAEWEEPGG